MKTLPSVAAELSWTDVHAFRLARHHLAERAAKPLLDRVVGDIGGAQAQVMSAAELQIAVRVDCTVQEVRDALWKRKTLVKTWLMRGTLHLTRADDLPLYTAAMSTRWIKVNPTWLRWIGLTEPELWQLVGALDDALDGNPMTREQLVEAAGKGRSERVRELLRSGWGGMLKPAARNGRLCFGPNRGQSVTFVRPHEWLGTWRDVDPDHALVEVARRYVRAYGPSTKQDFARWWGTWSGVGKAAWSGLRAELVDVEVEGRRAQMLAADLELLPAGPRGRSVQLLPAFDPYLLGHANRDHLFEAEHRPKVSRTAGWISPVVLVDGRVEAVWSHTVAKQRMKVEIKPFKALNPKVAREAAARVETIAGALGVKVDRLTIS